MNKPKISIIVPVYNSALYLERCINSILAQTFTDWELILVDDGSTDGSGVICDEYASNDNRIRVIHKPNGGVCSARQCGCDAVKAKYSIHIDSDDYVETCMLEDMYGVIVEKDADLVICDFYVNETFGCQRYTKQIVSENSSKLLIDILEMRTFGALWNKLIRHSLYKQYNVSFIKGINYCEDVLVLAQLLKNQLNTAYVPKGNYHYCFDKSDSITRKYTRETFKTRILFVEKLQEILPEKEYKQAIDIAALYVKLEANLRGFLPLRQFNKLLPTTIFTIWKTDRKLLSKLKYTVVIIANKIL